MQGCRQKFLIQKLNRLKIASGEIIFLYTVTLFLSALTHKHKHTGTLKL